MKGNKMDQQPTNQAYRERWGYIYWLLLTIVMLAYGFLGYYIFLKLYTGEKASGVMTFSFLVTLPIAINIAIGYLIKKFDKASFGETAVYGLFIISALIAIAGIWLKEGVICLIMAAPLFYAACLLGLVIGWYVPIAQGRASGKILSVTFLLPFLFGGIEQYFPLQSSVATITQSIFIAAPAPVLWDEIMNPADIKPQEITSEMIYKIGMPKPLGAQTSAQEIGAIRKSYWEKGVNFDEEITALEENRHVAWKYHFDDTSFPPGSLDDHIKVGGRYFDLEESQYRLKPVSGGTELELTTRYRIGTNFNWYAKWWADYFIHDASDAILRMYKNRAEEKRV